MNVEPTFEPRMLGPVSPSQADFLKAVEILGPEEAARVLADNRPSRRERRRRRTGAERRAAMKHAEAAARRRG